MYMIIFNLQSSNSPLMEQLIFFHDNSMLILILVTNLVAYMMMSMLFNKNNNYFLLSGQTIEIIWTIIPAIILLFIALPSLKLLYLLEENSKPYISLKAIGHQWYWKYEYSNFNLNFDSYMINKDDLQNYMFRLLDTDNRVILPFNYMIRLMISATDVIHSWTIPSLGIKVDATPGRINQLNFMMNRSSIFYGQCSEICGANHSFMPISIESISLNFFLKWLNNNL
uniref:Cytochrome c oxidase subunit 2 n=1 Tax=Mayetiola destructor TaxID=39758 RepID=C7FIJ3_MAYDE|nr:cytochrome c oxidase subunit II [Mayetiola destructor]